MIAMTSSFCSPPSIKAVKDTKTFNAKGGTIKTAIASIPKQEWCSSSGS